MGEESQSGDRRSEEGKGAGRDERWELGSLRLPTFVSAGMKTWTE